MISIVDYGMGNIGSIQNMLSYLGSESKLVSDATELRSATKIILPGVGAFDAGMTNLKNKRLISCLNEKVLLEKVPVLGICLGMQLMTKGSEEGSLQGLSWIEANTLKFNFSKDKRLKIPHMGWNYVNMTSDSSDKQVRKRFYFVHSYYVDCRHKADIFMTTHYGVDFVASFKRDNIWGVQFHPEKSHQFGLSLFSSFLSQ